jgi:hypothetical protein
VLRDHFRELGPTREVLEQASSLEALGINNLAWPLDATLRIVDHLEGRSIAVLGDDVLRVDQGRPTYTYDSWHSDPRVGEAFGEYATRSHAETRAYLGRYLVSAGVHQLRAGAGRYPSGRACRLIKACY